ncbi:type I methionyl aminopeptidase [Candidatus Roizmanbacteria bacterium CG10_big_fil_rev_8_21_14_0_10_39_6]|uniref:Methionine aminopeptidase n=1 Tax=Candidatus Roizmanbacteria bacterium CG10_big_fil_rev_8_21_14_0_10_39_6 TaxID=1974853 RepID=A0A2M8KSC1_9BACT|nr:MAG: type I methionyl aminopeptidase [Candidatus Roizmanbacteria bacterium CG10_big_fil_rev_8_21_14_0_10_39_6]
MDKKNAMIVGGKKLRKVVQELTPYIKVGTKLTDIDSKATRLIRENGGSPSFSTVPGYSWSTCLSVNEVVVHGVPSNYLLKEGDVLKLDIGIVYGGFHVDYSDTLTIGRIDNRVERFLKVGNSTLRHALTLVKDKVRIGIVSAYIQENIESAGYKVIHELTGHAVGEELHMEPYIPGVLVGSIDRTPCFRSGYAYAIEVIYSFHDNHVVLANKDGWSLRTKSFSQSACFENTVYVDEEKSILLV